MTPGTPLSDRPAVAEPEGSTWWDDERAFVGKRPTWSLILLAWLIPASVALLQSVASNLLRGTLGAEWPWALLQIPRWLTWVPRLHVEAETDLETELRELQAETEAAPSR